MWAAPLCQVVVKVMVLRLHHLSTLPLVHLLWETVTWSPRAWQAVTTEIVFPVLKTGCLG